MGAYSAYERAFGFLELEETESSVGAIQLLKMLAFFHFQDIHIDILKRAASIAKAEEEQEEKQNGEEAAEVST
jgi:hypothetical protein